MYETGEQLDHVEVVSWDGDDDVEKSGDCLHTLSDSAEVLVSAVPSRPIVRASVRVGDRQLTAVLDTGAGQSIIGSRFVDTENIVPCDEVIQSVGNHVTQTLGKTTVCVNMHGVNLELTDCLVLHDQESPITLIIGRDAMEKYGLCLNLESNSVSARTADGSKWTIYLPLDPKEACACLSTAVQCCAAQDLQIASGDTVELKCTAQLPAACTLCEGGSRQHVFSGQQAGASNLDFIEGIIDTSDIKVLVCNRGHAAASVRKGMILGRVDTAADSLLDLDMSVPVHVASAVPRNVIQPPSASEIPGLTDDQRAQVDDVFKRHAAVFMQSDTDPLKSSMTAHKIELTDETPIYIRPRRHSPPVTAEVERQCLDLERLGIIERCDSAWNAPIVPIRKRDGTLRLCVDYRRLNKNTVTTRFPMPDVNDAIFSTHHSTQWFSALDIAKAYYHLPIEEASRDFTGFSSGEAHWRFRRLAFGLKNAPAQFQKEMQAILRGFSRDRLVIYLDDLLLKEATFEGHLQLVDDVLSALESQGIKLNSSKCTWFQHEVKFLGHVISSKGLQKSPEYVEQVRKLERPQTVHQLRQFLGIVNYQRKFVEKCSVIAKPLSELTGLPPKTVLTWTDAMAASFEQLKAALQEDVMLSFPDFSADASPLSLWVDASSTGAGACLTQMQNGENKFIAFASMTFSSAQRNYSATGRELAALRWGVKTFHTFLCAVPFRIYTDHQALLYLHNMRLVNHRMARTVEELADYDFEILFVPGKSNFAADYLSRITPGDSSVTSISQGTGEIPPGLKHSLKPEGGGDTLVECLCQWKKLHRGERTNGTVLRQELVDEALRSPGRYQFKLDRHSRQTLKLMRLPGQPLAMEMLSVFAWTHKVKVVVHFGRESPLIFLGKDQETTDVVHLQCLAGIHFNLLCKDPDWVQESPVLVLHNQDEAVARPVQPSSIGEVNSATTARDKGGAPPVFQCHHGRQTQCSVPAVCNGVHLCALLDTGAAVGLISASALRNITRNGHAPVVQHTDVTIRGLCGTTQCERCVSADISLFPYEQPTRAVLLVDENDSFGHCLLIGADFLRATGTSIDFGREEIRTNNKAVPMFNGQDGQRSVAVSYVAKAAFPSAACIQAHQEHHPVLQQLSHHIAEGTACLPSELREYQRYLSGLELDEGLLVYRHDKHGAVSVVAQDWLAEIALSTHCEMAHIGRDKLCHLLSQHVFCPALHAVVADVVTSCSRCQLYKTTPQASAPPLQKIQTATPFELVSADVVMFPRSGRGFIGCLVAVDHCSKWAVAVPIRSKTSSAVAAAFENRVLPALLRKPRRLLSDNGPEFRGTEFENMLDRWDIKHTYSTPLRPQGNGAVERCNRSLGQLLRLLTNSASDWDVQLPRVMTTYNATRHAELKESPADFLLQHVHDGTSFPIVTGETQSTWKPGHPGFAPFIVGQRVKKVIHHAGHLLQNKFEPRYAGPLTVSHVGENGITYQVQTEDGRQLRTHHSQLRPWKEPPEYLRRALQRAQTQLMSAATPDVSSMPIRPGRSRIQPGLTEPSAPAAVVRPVAQDTSGLAPDRPVVVIPWKQAVPGPASSTARDSGGRSSEYRSCLRTPGVTGAGDGRRVRFSVSDINGEKRPLHSSPFLRRSGRLRARFRSHFPGSTTMENARSQESDVCTEQADR